MAGSLKPYPAYKESGSTWLGAVPEHWKVRNLRTLVTVRNERNRPDLPLLSVAREKGVFVRSLTGEDENHNFIPDDLRNYKVARAGNLVINKMKAWQGSMGIAPCDGVVSPAYFVFDFRMANRAFGQALLRSKPYVYHFGQASDGVRIGQWDLSIPGMRQIPIVVPDEDEQIAIVRFLEHMNRRVVRAVRTKGKLIKLLNEQKQAIIHRTVTRGLDPNFHLKPSGVEWLGDFPNHWEILALKRILRQLIDCEHKTAPTIDTSEYRVVRTSAVRNGRLCLEGTYCTTAFAYKDWTRRGVPQSGDVIFTREAPAGEACVVPTGKNLCLGQRTVLLKLRPNDYDPRFLVHMIYAGPPRNLIRLASQGSTVGHFNMDDIGWMQVLKPPLVEQKEIANWIANSTRVNDLAISRAEAEIVLLREYRTRLIADVVTGKLDVRGVELPISDEAEAPESIDDAVDADIEEIIDREEGADGNE
jgi:type I restriction enzyme S subunit